LTALIVNRRPEAEFLLIAPTIEIANIAFKQAKGTIRLDPALDKTLPDPATTSRRSRTARNGASAADQGR
jgi:phage terminase large subunit-like protein